MAKNDIKVIHNFISKEESESLKQYEIYLTENNLWDVGDEKGDPYKLWSNRFIGAFKLQDERFGFGKKQDLHIFDMLINIRKRIKNKIIEEYNLEKPIYADSLNLIRWMKGWVQPAHSDYENFGGQEHVYNWRQIGCVLYLNEDFVGGELIFPQHGVQLPIKEGMLGFFPGDVNHAHGVNRILDGTRYTISMFWTTHKEHADNLPQ